MKKFFYLLLASVFAFAFTSCSDDDDEGGNGGIGAGSFVEQIVGNYESMMITTLKEMPTDPSKSKGTLTIVNAGNDRINVVLPESGSGMMGIPSVTLTELEVTVNNGTYTFAKETEGTLDVNGAQKKYSVKFNGEIKADGSFSFVEEMKFGKMPYTMVIKYSKFTNADMVTGTYDCLLLSGLIEMPDDAPSKSKGELKVELVDANKVNVILPAYGAGMMKLPSITLTNVEVVAGADGSYTFAKEEKGNVEVDGAQKKYAAKFTGTVKADGSFAFHEEMKYGNMPYTFFMDYSAYSDAAFVAGDYQTDMEVSIQEKPEMGVAITGTPVLKMEAAGSGLKVVLPEMTYAAMNMTIPSLTIENVKVQPQKDNSFKFTADYKGELEGKAYESTFDGVLNADGTFEYTAVVKYGKMPLHLVAVFTPQAKEQK